MLCFLTLPVLWFPVLGLWLGSLYDLRMAKRRSSSPTAHALGLEATAFLLIIPILTTLATVGTSLAFYLWTKKRVTLHHDADAILIVTVGLALLVPIVWAQLIIGHRSGADPLPFEPDVDPAAGIRSLRSKNWRLESPGGFLSAPKLLAIEQVESPCQNQQGQSYLTARDAAAAIWVSDQDRRQFLALLIGAALWTGLFLFIHGIWWLLLASPLSLLLLLVSSVTLGKTTYWLRLRWKRREGQLWFLLHKAQEIEEHRQELLTEVRCARAEIGRLTAQRGVLGKLMTVLRRSRTDSEPR